MVGVRWGLLCLLVVLLAACNTPGTTSTLLAPPTPTPSPGPSPVAKNATGEGSATLTPSPIQNPKSQIQNSPTPSRPFPNPDDYTWQLVASGLSRPVGLSNAGDGSGRPFVVEQGGLIRIVKDGALLPTPFLDLSQKVSCCGERGLLGLAFHPRYPQNGYFYVNYTDANGNTVIARFTASADPDVADPASETALLHVDQPFPNHNGGGLAFGPDGYLYMALGDGGGAGDPFGNAQSLDTLLGKLLRVDVERGDPSAIPPDNPFIGIGEPEIWAYGLRNPWCFSFDRLTGDLYIGEVGQNAWEEIDFLLAGSPGGANFGWNYFEGTHLYASQPPLGVGVIHPVAEYGHDLGYSVTGGVVYRGVNLPDWQGVYLYGDYGSGLVWGLRRDADGNWAYARLFDSGAAITSFGEDEAGEVYLADYRGNIYRLSANE